MIILLILLFTFTILFLTNFKGRSKGNNCRERYENTPEDSFNFVKFFPKILYINLEKRADRNQEFLSNFPHLSENNNTIERIDAVLEIENGHIGCLKSHIKALKRALVCAHSENFPFILICEDDFHVKDMKYAIESLQRFFDSFSDDEWDVLMLGINLLSKKDTEFEGIIKVNSAQTTSSYLIKTDYIQKLIDVYARDLSEFEKTGKWSDWYCTDQSWKKLQSKDKWYSFQPAIGVQRKSYSDIMKGVVNYNL